MGTRAAFWIGNPVNLKSREWLGCIAWDGHIENFEELASIGSEEEFQTWIEQFSKTRNDFAFPENGWPFPWANDVFLTDVTYAFFNGAVNVCWFHEEFMPLKEYLEFDWEFGEGPAECPAHKNVPAPSKYNPEQPDSIIIISAK